ncbi:PREDICTED: subtilisin [Prunus dulcis]|nr:PREDICTED: subtilisin [Prunus dulcis]
MESVMTSNKIVIAYAEEVSRPNVSMKFKETIQETKNAPMVPAHSARGPSPGFPNILGASIPEEVTAKIGLKPLKSNYNVVSRTSIACPHVAGLAALLKAALPE